uniref:Tubulin polyglutamylase complex subunit 2 n=1 Tax=Malurus cyaneus samueli TaxID=2593467 RepID=A0A8C5X3L0_9PASS
MKPLQKITPWRQLVCVYVIESENGLETSPGVAEVTFVEKEPAERHTIVSWEQVSIFLVKLQFVSKLDLPTLFQLSVSLFSLSNSFQFLLSLSFAFSLPNLLARAGPIACSTTL